MSIRRRKALKAMAAFVVFAICQVSVQLSFAEPNSTTAAIPAQQIVVARLVTSRDQPITVNGASAATGATILTGATIQTPDAVGATINLGALGTIDLAPNTTIRLEFTDDKKVRVVLIAGCVIVSGAKDTETEVVTEQGTTTTKKEKGAGGPPLDVCFPAGASAPTVGQGAAAAAGAGAGGGGAAAVSTGAGLSTAEIVAIAGGAGAVAVIVPLVLRGDNPSPSNP